ncbi:double zinc ribbon domain-containing protein [Halegenticoccus tardaugens]|uniref:double zinc ribbon domain-containing protein n=1 Tax=Halegenticoccus tardaugens TaxID=2071624 RepID=UPI00100BE9D7|nr:zinc ribbon domain-containing protein [Halegenticoccus tardaugens]
MSKITFRADDDLVDRLEAFDASKSEVMREALRSYLDEAERGERIERDVTETSDEPTTLDGALVERVDALVAERLDGVVEDLARSRSGSPPRDVNVNLVVEGAAAHHRDGAVEPADAGARKTSAEPTADETTAAGGRTCGQCGEGMNEGDVYCPNCGEKASHRVFCECGDEVRSDWAFCPGCGRRTPAADVLDRS